MHNPLTPKPQHNEQLSEIANLLSLAELSKENTDNSSTEHIQQLSRTAQAQALLDAVREKDLAKLETLLRAGVDPLIRTGAILLGAVASRFGDGVCLMLEYVKQPPQSSPKLERRQAILLQACLDTACEDPKCDLTTVRALIIAKAYHTENELSSAIRNGRLDVVIELHRAGGDIRFTENRLRRKWPGGPRNPDDDKPLKDRPLLYAIMYNRLDIVDYLIQHGAELVNVGKEVTQGMCDARYAKIEPSPEMFKYLTERGLKPQDAEQERKNMDDRRQQEAEKEQLRIKSDPEYASRLAQMAEEHRMIESFPYKRSDGSGATTYEHLSVDHIIKYIDLARNGKLSSEGDDHWRRTIQAIDILEEQGDLTPEVCDKVLRHFLLSRNLWGSFRGERIILHLTSKGASVSGITSDIEKWRLTSGRLLECQTLYELGVDISCIIEGRFETGGAEGFNYSYHLCHFQLNRDSYMESCGPLLREVLSCSGPSVIDRGAQLASRIALFTAKWVEVSFSYNSQGKAHDIFRLILTNELQALERTARKEGRGKLEQEIDELLRDAVDFGKCWFPVRYSWDHGKIAINRIANEVAPFARVEVVGKAGAQSERYIDLLRKNLHSRLFATRGLRGVIDLIKLMNDPRTLPPLEYRPYHALAESRYHGGLKQWEPLFEGEIRLGDNYVARCTRSELECGWQSGPISGIGGAPWYVSISKDGKRCGLLEVKLETRSEGVSSTGRGLMIRECLLHGEDRAPNLGDLSKELEQKAQAGEIMFNKRIDCIVGIPEFVQRLTMSERELLTGVPDDEPELLTRYCEHYLKLEQQLGRRILDDVSFEDIIRETQTPK
jgi:hypothetical protein